MTAALHSCHPPSQHSRPHTVKPPAVHRHQLPLPSHAAAAKQHPVAAQLIQTRSLPKARCTTCELGNAQASCPASPLPPSTQLLADSPCGTWWPCFMSPAPHCSARSSQNCMAEAAPGKACPQTQAQRTGTPCCGSGCIVLLYKRRQGLC
jgi:hypothetical protein